MKPHDDPAWSHYTETVLVFERGGSIDLRQPVRAAQLELLRTLGLDGEFAIITPANPRGERIDDKANEQRFDALAAELERRALRHVAVTGRSVDGSHGEKGFAVVTSASVARDIAREAGQSALYWFDGARFRIHGALVETPPIALPAVR